MNTPHFSPPSRFLRSAASRVEGGPLSSQATWPRRSPERWLIAWSLLLAGGIWWWLPRDQPETEAAGRPSEPAASVAMSETDAPEPDLPEATPMAAGSSSAADPTLPEALAGLPQGEQVSLQEALFEAMHAVTALTEEEQGYPGNEGASHFVAHPRQRFTVRFLREGGVRLGSEREENGWQGTVRLAAVFHQADQTDPSDRADLPGGVWYAQGRRAERPTADGALTEWYENRAEGLEHGFTLARRPTRADRGAAPAPEAETDAEAVVLALALEGWRAEADPERPGDLRLLEAETGRAVLGYRNLKVWDATGRELPAAMEPSPAGIRLAYHDAGAVYPVTVDPLFAVLEAEFGANQQTRFVSNDHVAGDGFGFSLAADGDTVLLGAANARSGRGAAYVFIRENGQWKQQAKLTHPEAAPVTHFGRSVALDGGTAVVGTYAPQGIEGAAYVFTRDGTRWSLDAKLNPPEGLPQGLYGDNFGATAAVSGNTILVGAPQHANNKGTVYRYSKVGSIWTARGELLPQDPVTTTYGQCLALKGGRAVVGSHMAVYVFRGPPWTQEGKLTPHPGTAATFFGNDVALEGDIVLVGDDTKDIWAINSGAVHVFMRGSNGTWALEDRMVPPSGEVDDWFGRKVALKNGYALIGSSKGIQAGTGNGAAYLFRKIGNGWELIKEITPPAGEQFDKGVALAGGAALVSGNMVYSFPLDSFSANELHAHAHFGLHADLDGNMAVIGALDYNVAGLASAGAAWTFQRGDAGWVTGQKLIQVGAAAGDRFGVSVGVSGPTLVVGADGDDEGARTNAGSVTIYHLDLLAGWRITGQQFHTQANAQLGRAVAVDGTNVVAGAPGFSSGSGQVQFWRKTGPNPWQWGYTTATPPAPQSNALFGFSVAISGNRALVGEPGRDEETLNNCGRVSVFEDPDGDGNWDSSRQINGRQAQARAGFAVAIDGAVAVAGCGGPPGWAIGGPNSGELGAAFVFDPRGGLLALPVQYLDASGLQVPAGAGAYFGMAVAVEGNVIAVGAAGDGVAAGSVRLFQPTGRGLWGIAGPDTQSPSLLLNGHAEPGNYFGGALALSGGTLLVGAFATDDHHTNNGAVFLYQILDPFARPTLDITFDGNMATLHWPLHTGLALWASPTMAPGSWFKISGTETRHSFDIQTSNQPQMFYRLGPP